MADNSRIEWTDATINPVVGCGRGTIGGKCSPACIPGHCYAERMAARLASIALVPGRDHAPVFDAYYDVMTVKPPATMAGEAKIIPRWNGKVVFVESALDAPFRWRKPRRIFVCSMGDLFAPGVPDAWIDRVWGMMACCPQHTFIVLSKQSERMHGYLNQMGVRFACRNIADEMVSAGKANIVPSDLRWPLPNVWLGVTCENQAAADERIPWLLKTPAAVHFISHEPALGAIDYEKYPLDWAAIGVETGPKRRPTHEDVIYSALSMCAATETPIFVKKWYDPDTNRPTADMSRWPEWMRIRQLPAATAKGGA